MLLQISAILLQFCLAIYTTREMHRERAIFAEEHQTMAVQV